MDLQRHSATNERTSDEDARLQIPEHQEVTELALADAEPVSARPAAIGVGVREAGAQLDPGLLEIKEASVRAYGTQAIAQMRGELTRGTLAGETLLRSPNRAARRLTDRELRLSAPRRVWLPRVRPRRPVHPDAVLSRQARRAEAASREAAEAEWSI